MTRSLLLLGCLLTVGIAHAKPDPFDYRVADLALLQAKVVQTELSITSAQRAKMQAAASAHQSRLAAYDKQLQASKGKPDPKRLLGYVGTLKEQVMAILTPAQLKRLREITLQRLDLMALTDNEVGRRAGLSPAQIKKEQALFAAGQKQFNARQQSLLNPVVAPYRSAKPKDRAEAERMQKELNAKVNSVETKAAPELQKIRASTRSKMLAVLTAKQRAAWEKLKGKRFSPK